MKRSYLIALLIILVGVIISWPDRRKFTDFKEQNVQLVQAVPRLSTARHQEPSQKNPRDSRDSTIAADGKSLALEYIHLLRLSKRYKNAQNPSETYSDERMNELRERIKNLPLSQIKSFFEEFNRSADPSELSASYIRNEISDLMQLFSAIYPVEMIDLLLASPEIFNNEKNNINAHQASIIYNIAHYKNDPTTAFQCLAKLEPSMQSKAISTIISAAKTPEKRTDTLEAMRAFATTPEQRELVMEHMNELAFGDGGVRLDFVDNSEWLMSAALSMEELKSATRGLEKKVQNSDTAQWIDWLSSSGLPEKDTQFRVLALASEWTKKDYRAVGQWLNNTTDGPVKHAVIVGYAMNTFAHDPVNTMKWVETLPQGHERNATIENFYRMIPKNSDAAKAFAREYGIGQ